MGREGDPRGQMAAREARRAPAGATSTDLSSAAMQTDPCTPLFHPELFAHGRLLYRYAGSDAHRFSPRLAYRLLRDLDTGAPGSPSVLWDPFCGAGTIPLEAANLLAGMPAGGRRKFAFEQWPVHDAEAWAAIKQGVPEPAAPDSLIIGSDRSDKALDAARHNTAEAGLEGHVRWLQGDFDQVAEQVPEGATVVCNPPYGLRSQGRLDNVYRRLGQLLGRRFDLRPVVALSGYHEMPRLTGRPWQAPYTLSNRGLPVKILRLER